MEMGVPRLTVRLFGFPQIHLSDRKVEVQRREALALLAYLAAADSPRGRDTLAEMFYPESRRDAAYSGLRMLLSALRNGLGAEHINSDRHSIALNLKSNDHVDVREFRRLLANGERLCGNLPDFASCLRQAEELYTERFLGDFYLDRCHAFEEWQQDEAATLHGHYVAVLDRLSDAYEEDGQFGPAIEFALKRVRVDREDEAAVRRLMDLCVEAERPLDALDHYRSLCTHLQTEYGSQPDSETQEQALTVRRELELPTHLSVPALPRTAGTFVGRKEEVRDITSAVFSPDDPVVTITGPAGVGKTRLTLEAIAGIEGNFEHGCAFVDLTASANANDFFRMIADATQIQGIAADPRSHHDVVLEALEGRDTLLLLDNAEHLLPDVAGHILKLAGCHGPTIVVTSREPLGIAGERLIELEPLPVWTSDDTADRGESPSVELFLDRLDEAGVSHEWFSGRDNIVAEICRQLDGLPLALELAARKARVVSPERLLAAVRHHLRLLTGGRRGKPERHASMRSALGWSYDRLPSAARQLFMRLSVFTGGFTTDGAAAGGATDQSMNDWLVSLVDEHLLTTTPDRSRFGMLHVVREFAAEMAEAEKCAEPAREDMLEYLTSVAESGEQLLRGPRYLATLKELSAELPNFRAALNYCVQTDRGLAGLRLAANLGGFWLRRGLFGEGAQWLDRFLVLNADAREPQHAARAGFHLAFLLRMVGTGTFSWTSPVPECISALKMSVKRAREAGDRQQVALSLVALGTMDSSLPLEDRCRQADEAVKRARELRDPWVASFCIRHANCMIPREDKPAADVDAALQECVDLAEQTGDPWLLGQAMHGVGDGFMFRGDHENAEPWYERALEICRNIDDVWTHTGTLYHLVCGFLVRQDYPRARCHLRDGLRLACDHNVTVYQGMFLYLCGVLLRRQGRNEEGVRLMAASNRFAKERHKEAVKEVMSHPWGRRVWEEGLATSRKDALEMGFAVLSEE
jgi:predicted ATPase/DNA-binding SARP family transcriptional activator